MFLNVFIVQITHSILIGPILEVFTFIKRACVTLSNTNRGTMGQVMTYTKRRPHDRNCFFFASMACNMGCLFWW